MSALDDARKASAERAAARVAAAEGRELEELTLEEKYEKELGPRGVEFDILRTVEGPIVVKLGDVTHHKKLGALKTERTDADIFEYVKYSIVHPTLQRFSEVVAKRGDIAAQCALILMRLHEGREAVQQGK